MKGIFKPLKVYPNLKPTVVVLKPVYLINSKSRSLEPGPIIWPVGNFLGPVKLTLWNRLQPTVPVLYCRGPQSLDHGP